MMKNILLFTLLVGWILPALPQRISKKPEIGIAQDFQNDSLLYASGYRYLVESIAKCFSPKNVSDQQFRDNLQAFEKLNLAIYAVNIFIPGDLKLVGPEVNEEAILSHAKGVFERCKTAGVKMVIWGSGGARRVPEGFDEGKAKDQFVSIARKVSVLAKQYKIVVALENLNRTETNFITTVDEAYKIVQKVNHPNLRLCVDIYHMLMEGEPPSVIEQTKPYLIHCDIAEKENRAPPGVKGDDFREYLKVLRTIGYTGKIILECRWENLAMQAKPARENLQKQIDEVYND